MVGRRVHHIYMDDRFEVVKCPASVDRDAIVEDICIRVGRGERGSIVKIEQFTPNQHFLVVRWDGTSQSEPMFSYVESTMYRLSLKGQ